MSHHNDGCTANSYSTLQTMPTATGDNPRWHSSLPRTIDRFARVLVVAVALGLSACGGGGGGGSAPPPAGGPDVSLDDLAGTWFGTLEDAARTLHTLALTFGAPTAPACTAPSTSPTCGSTCPRAGCCSGT